MGPASDQRGDVTKVFKLRTGAPQLLAPLRLELITAMATNTDPQNEVLHSEGHSQLSTEEIAKAVARHNKNHSHAKAENAGAKPPNVSAKAKKGSKS